MRGIRILLRDWYNMRVFFWISIVISLAGGSLSFFMHEEYGSEEYIMPKMFIMFPAMMITELWLICGCRNIVANRLTRSMPIAKELYTRSVPTLIVLFSAGATVLIIGVYFIFLACKDAQVCQYSDTLVCAALAVFPLLIIAPFASMFVAGGLLIIYGEFPGLLLVLLISGENVLRYGFGLPLWAAALIFAASAAAGIIFAFRVCAVRYKKSNVKIVQPMMQN